MAVFFKNFIEKHWDSNEAPVAEQDKQFIRANLIQVVASVGNVAVVRVQLLSCVYKLMRFDGDKWPQVEEQVLALLQSQDAGSVATGLFVALEVLKARSLGGDRRLEGTLSKFMPALLAIGEQALSALTSATAASADELAMMVKTVSKAFFSGIRYKFSAFLLGNVGHFSAWFGFLHRCLSLPCPALEVPKDSEDVSMFDRHIFWKLRKWTLRSLNRLAARYGRKDEAFGKDEKAFAKVFAGQAAVPSMYAVLGLVREALGTEASDANRASTGAWALTNQCTSLVTEHLTTAVRVKQTWTVIKNEGHLSAIIGAFAFPRLAISACELEEWQSDPASFLKSVFFSFDDYDSPRTCCSTFISDVVKARTSHVMPMLLQHIQTVLDAYSQAPCPVSDAVARQKDAALVLLGSISTELCSDSSLKAQIPTLMQIHVIPDLAASHAFLRLRSAWCLEQFAEVPLGPAVISVLIQGLLTVMKDAELPVRAQAAVTIGSMLDQEGFKESLRPNLGPVVTTTLELTNAIELDALSYVMDRFVALFPEDLSPYAAELTLRLRDSLLNLLENSLEADADKPGHYYFNDTDKMMAALAQIDTLDTIVIQMCNLPEVALRCEALLVPLGRYILERRLDDLMSECGSLLESITFRTKAVSPGMWELGDLMLHLLRTEMAEFLPECAGVLENLISYGAGEMLARPERAVALVAVIERALRIDPEGYGSDNERHSAIDLLETMLLYCRGMVDAFLPRFVQMGLEGLADCAKDEPENRSTVNCVRYLELLLNALYYSAPTTVQLLNSSAGAWPMLLELWAAALPGFKRVHDKRLIMAALSALFMEVPASLLPAEVAAMLPSLLGVYVETVRSYPKALEERERLKKAEEEAADDAGDDAEDADELIASRNYGQLVDEEEDGAEEAEPVDGDAEQDGDGDGDLDDDDWEDDDWEDSDELEEDLYFECPLDSIDFTHMVRATMAELPLRNPELWQRMASALSAEQQAALQALL